jgi:hypothetical protein
MPFIGDHGPILYHESQAADPDRQDSSDAPWWSVSDLCSVLRCRGWVALAMIASGTLLQVNSAQRSCQVAMKRPITALRSATVERCRGVGLAGEDREERLHQVEPVGRGRMMGSCTRG